MEMQQQGRGRQEDTAAHMELARENQDIPFLQIHPQPIPSSAIFQRTSFCCTSSYKFKHQNKRRGARRGQVFRQAGRQPAAQTLSTGRHLPCPLLLPIPAFYLFPSFLFFFSSHFPSECEGDLHHLARGVFVSSLSFLFSESSSGFASLSPLIQPHKGGNWSRICLILYGQRQLGRDGCSAKAGVDPPQTHTVLARNPTDARKWNFTGNAASSQLISHTKGTLTHSRAASCCRRAERLPQTSSLFPV